MEKVRLFLFKPLLIIGAGGHASVLVDMLRQQKREIIGLVSPMLESKSKVFDGIEHFKSDGDVLKFDNQSVKLVNGIGSLPGNNLRAEIYSKFKALGYQFETIVASNSIVSEYVELAEGVQIFNGAIVQTNTIIGTNSIINTGAIVEHDCAIGGNNHIAPGVTLSGHVTTSEHVHVGTGATIIQNVKVGANSVVSAGAMLTKDLGENTVHFPAKPFQKSKK
jgi:sugar O-acyltransferase (sialic acid O-acetyltransferase NeuD family)